jgi:hypothetical protein
MDRYSFGCWVGQVTTLGALLFAAPDALAAPPVIVSITFDDAIDDTATDDNPAALLDDVFERAASLVDRDTVVSEASCPNVGGVGDAPQADEAADCDVPSTFYLNFPRLDEAKFFTTEQVRLLDAWGHEIGGHSAHHLDLPRLEASLEDPDDLDSQRLQVCWDRRRLSLIPKLDGSGTLLVRSFAYPFGSYEWLGDPLLIARFGEPVPTLLPDRTRGLIGRNHPGECGYRSARITGEVANTPACTDGSAVTPCIWAETPRPADVFAIRAPSSIGADTPLDYPVVPVNDDGDGVYDRPEEFESRAHTVKGWIENAAANTLPGSQSWIVLTLHSVCLNRNCNQYGIDRHDFTALLTWLRQKRKAGEIELRSVSQALTHPREYRVTVPPLPMSPSGVRNADLSLDNNRDYIPDCFQVSGSGFLDGGEQAEIIRTAHANADVDGDGITNDGAFGDAWYGWLLMPQGSARGRFLTRLDLGHCAPRVKPGNRYLLSFKYRVAPRRECPFFELPGQQPCPITTLQDESGAPPQYFLIHAFRRPAGTSTSRPLDDGHWLGFTQVPLPSPTQDWILASAEIIPPAGVNALSFGLEIRHNTASGTAQADVDDFSYCRLSEDPSDSVAPCP